MEHLSDCSFGDTECKFLNEFKILCEFSGPIQRCLGIVQGKGHLSSWCLALVYQCQSL